MIKEKNKKPLVNIPKIKIVKEKITEKTVTQYNIAFTQTGTFLGFMINVLSLIV